MYTQHSHANHAHHTHMYNTKHAHTHVQHTTPHIQHTHSGTTVNNIEKAKGPDPVNIANEIFSHWLAGKGRIPVTWITLVECLRDVHLNVLASMIMDMYKQIEESTDSQSLKSKMAHRNKEEF